MESIVNAALLASKSNVDAKLSGVEHAHASNMEQPRHHRKRARISELLLESGRDIQEKLAELGEAVIKNQNDVEGSIAGSSVAGSVYAPSAAGSMRGSQQGSIRGGAAGLSTARNQWRKLNKAMAATKALANRPNAFAPGKSNVMAALHQEHLKDMQSPGPPGSNSPTPPSDPNASLVRKLSTTLHAVAAKAVILPETTWYQLWWFYYAVAIAIFSCWLEPYLMAFHGTRAPIPTWLQVAEYFILVTYFLDFVFKFFVAYVDSETGVLVTTQPHMAFGYIKSFKFVLDVLGCFPYDLIVSSISRQRGASMEVTDSLGWLRLLALSRAYRILDLFAMLDYRMLLSQGTLLLLRNYMYVFFSAHWAACIFFHVANEETAFHKDSWVQRNAHAFDGKPKGEQYILALYFVITVFTAMGDPNFYPFTSVEMALMILYLLFNLFLAAYIIGTVTIMMVRADERSKSFRESMGHLQEYSKDNELPERLHKAMKEHLEVHFDSAQTTDDKVLGIYPTTIRRRALRHLYLNPVKNCYIFRGCKQRFLDALLTAARVELFLPGVEILTEGDNVTELLIVVGGEVSAVQGGQRPGGVYGGMTGASTGVGSEQLSASSLRSFLSSNGDGGGSVGESAAGSETSLRGAISVLSPGGITVGVSGSKGSQGSSAILGPSSALSELAFFTDGASYESVVGTTPVRVMSLTKASWELLEQQFPQQARQVFENVQKAAERAVEDSLKAAAASSQLTASQLHVALSLVNGKSGFVDNTDPMLLAQTRDALTHQQMELITRLDDIRTVAAAHVRKCDEMRTFEFLNTAAQGDVESLRTMLRQGISPNTADYDGRTGLMLAAAKGHDETVRLLLDSGADKDKTDAFGISALAEAAKNAHDSTIELMLNYGATLGGGGLTVAAEMCTAVYEGDIIKLRRLLRAGAPPNSCDYDKRSPLHIAGAEGNINAVKLLIEEGGADSNFQDRWGNTALDEARRVGAATVAAYLESKQKRDLASTAEKKRQQMAHEYMSWCNSGEVSELRRAGGYAFGDEAGCAFAGLLVVASKGHTELVEVLLEDMPSNVAQHHAHVAMLEAARMGHPATVAAFRAAGVMLPNRGSGGSGGSGGGGDSRSSSSHSPPQLFASDALLRRLLAAEMRNAAQQGNGAVVEALLVAGVSGRWQQEPQQMSQGGGGSGGGGAVLAGPLHLAAEHSHLGVTRRLVEHGGAHNDLTVPDGMGATPLTVAERVTRMVPADARARAVHAYLSWATPLAVDGSSMQQLAVAALERWGPIGTTGTVGAADKGTSAVMVASWADKPGATSQQQSGPSSRSGPSPRATQIDNPTGLIKPFAQPPARKDSITATTTTTPPKLTTTGFGTGLPTAGSGTTTANGFLSASYSNGSSAAAAAALHDGAAAVAEAWDNLPGTPGSSTRGGSLALRALQQQSSGTNAQSSSQTQCSSPFEHPNLHFQYQANQQPQNQQQQHQVLYLDPSVALDAAMAFSASVAHSASLLNDPPATTTTTTATTTSTLGYSGGGGGSGGVSRSASLALRSPPEPGRMPSSGGMGGLGSPCLKLPPAPPQQLLLPSLGSAGGGGGGGGNVRAAAAVGATPLPPTSPNAGSTAAAGAASRLFGTASPLTPPTPALVAIGSNRAGSVAHVPNSSGGDVTLAQGGQNQNELAAGGGGAAAAAAAAAVGGGGGGGGGGGDGGGVSGGREGPRAGNSPAGGGGGGGGGAGGGATAARAWRCSSLPPPPTASGGDEVEDLMGSVSASGWVQGAGGDGGGAMDPEGSGDGVGGGRFGGGGSRSGVVRVRDASTRGAGRSEFRPVLIAAQLHVEGSFGQYEGSRKGVGGGRDVRGGGLGGGGTVSGMGAVLSPRAGGPRLGASGTGMGGGGSLGGTRSLPQTREGTLPQY